MKKVLGIIKNAFITIAGIGCATLGIKGFLLPNKFIDGGVTGISMLLASQTHLSLPLVIVLINIPFIFLGFKRIGKTFAIHSGVAILGLSLALILIDLDGITQDKLLSAVFGGVFLGAGIGLSMRGGGVLDGTEIMALVFSKKIGITIGDVILIVNLLIFSISAIFLGIETAMYSILTYYSASKTVDFLIHGIEEYIGVTIISSRSEELKKTIMKDLGWGLTVYKGQGGLSQQDQEILFCTVTRLEIPKVRKVLNAVDPYAFVVMHNIHDTSGGMIKRKFNKML